MLYLISEALANVGYLVAVVAYNLQGLPVGGGCIQEIMVMPGKTVELTVHVLPLSLNPVGQYLVDVVLDVEAILGPLWQDVGQHWAGLFQDAVNVISTRVVDDLQLFFPEGFPEACGDVALEIRTGMTIALGAGYPPAVVTQMAGGADTLMRQLLSSVVFMGTLDVQETGVPGEFAGKLSVQALEFQGPAPCALPECADLLSFVNEAFNLGEVKLELADTTFVAGTQGFDKLVFTLDVWPVRPGKLFLYAFLNTVMPAYDLPTSVRDYTISLFVCQSLMSLVSPDTITCLNKSLQSFVASCNAAVGNLWIQYYDGFPELIKPQYLSVEASLSMLDDNADLVTDRVQGTFTGTLVHDGVNHGDVEATVDGARK